MLSANDTLLAGAKRTTANPQRKRQLAKIESRVTRQYHRGFTQLCKPKLSFTDNLATPLILHDVAAGVSRVVGRAPTTRNPPHTPQYLRKSHGYR